MLKVILSSFFAFSILLVNAQEWQTDLEAAKAIATEENKSIVLVFQGSDWCAPCIKLDKQIWSTQEFEAIAQSEFVMLKADFPRRRKNALANEQQTKNNKLAEIYNKKGFFPLVVVLDKEGKVLGETGYQKNTTPREYAELLSSYKAKI